MADLKKKKVNAQQKGSFTYFQPPHMTLDLSYNPLLCPESEIIHSFLQN